MCGAAGSPPANANAKSPRKALAARGYSAASSHQAHRVGGDPDVHSTGRRWPPPAGLGHLLINVRPPAWLVAGQYCLLATRAPSPERKRPPPCVARRGSILLAGHKSALPGAKTPKSSSRGRPGRPHPTPKGLLCAAAPPPTTRD